MKKAVFLFSLCLATGAESQDPDLLYVWAWDADQKSSDFLAVFDEDGNLLTTVTVGLIGGAHHTEHRMPEGDLFFANAFASGTTFLFDVTEPTKPRVRSSFEHRGPYTYPHSFERLPNGNVLATFQNKGEGNQEPGGLVELDPVGNFVRGSDAADPEVEPDLRPYSLLILPERDRVVSTTTDMRGYGKNSSVQLWRLSDLQLLKTFKLPPGERGDENRMPAEPRLLADGRTVVVNTFFCGLYRIDGIDGDAPDARHLSTLPVAERLLCALPALIGNYWIQTVPAIESLVALDMSDPEKPETAHTLKLRGEHRPHWLASDTVGERIVLTGGGRVSLIRFDADSGRMELDKELDFSRTVWPHGETGPAVPHGAIFSR